LMGGYEKQDLANTVWFLKGTNDFQTENTCVTVSKDCW